MKMDVIKWDESMAWRCISRIDKGFVTQYKQGVKGLNKTVQSESWDDFKYAIDKAIAKKSK